MTSYWIFQLWVQRTFSASTIASLATLQHLQVSFAGCVQLCDISAFGRLIAPLAALEHLRISFDDCDELSDISALGESIASLITLQHLRIGFRTCVRLSDISAFGASLASLPSLQHLQISVAGCRQLLSISALGASYQSHRRQHYSIYEPVLQDDVSYWVLQLWVHHINRTVTFANQCQLQGVGSDQLFQLCVHQYHPCKNYNICKSTLKSIFI